MSGARVLIVRIIPVAMPRINSVLNKGMRKTDNWDVAGKMLLKMMPIMHCRSIEELQRL